MTHRPDSGRWILEACAAADGGVSIRALVGQHMRAGHAGPVARASLSRSLRRLWRRGLVELYGTKMYRGYILSPDEWGRDDTLTRRADAARRRLADAEANPQTYFDHVSGLLGPDNPHADPAALVAFHRARVARGPQGGYLRWVLLTDAGRAAVNSMGKCEVNQTQAGAHS